MRPYVFGVVLLSCWTFITVGVLANFAGIEGVGNRPTIISPVDAPRVEPRDTDTDAAVPFAESVTRSADLCRL